MKVKIIKKNIKQGVSNGREYCIKSLLVTFTEKDVYDKLVDYLGDLGASADDIAKFVKPGEHNGNTTYGFFLNCSDFTFNAVEQFGFMDAKIMFTKNEKGYLNARIQVVDKVEQVLSYEAPESNVTGWATQTTHQHVQSAPQAPKEPATTYTQDHRSSQTTEDNGLPF